MRTPEETLALATINPELEQILKTSPPVGQLTADTDVQKLRAWIVANKQTTPPPPSASYTEEDRQIPVRDGNTITIRIHKPRIAPADGCPIFVVYHGGGFVLGDLDSEAWLCRTFTELGGIAVNVGYRLAPEYQFPVPCEDAYDALKWTASHFEELGGNPSKGFLIGGISAGANFASILSHLYRDDKLSPPLTGSYLSIPPCLTPATVPEKYKSLWLSREQNKDAPILNTGSMALFEKCYKADRTLPLGSPGVFSSHKDLPPTYFQVCGMDPLRDEGLIYEEMLREDNGLETLMHVYPGLPHGFWATYPTASFVAPYRDDCVKGMKWLLEKSK